MTEYYKEWYQKNKDRISEKRKKLYNNDESYRECILKRGKSYRVRSKEDKIISRDEGECTFNGKELIAYRTSRLCKALNKGRGSINYWIEKGYMPKTPLLTNDGDPLYTMAMIDVVVKAYEARGNRVSKDNDMIGEISNGWAKVLLRLK